MRDQPSHKKLLGEITIWLVSEVVLTLTGLDDIANYSEFLLNQDLFHSQPTMQYVAEIG
jgi:hypothetical protein